MPARTLLTLSAVAGGAVVWATLAARLDGLYSAAPRLRSRRRLAEVCDAGSCCSSWRRPCFGGLRHSRGGPPSVSVDVPLRGTTLLALSATDFERHLLPNRLMYPCLLAALLVSAAWLQGPSVALMAGGDVGSTWPHWVSDAVGATLSGLGGGLAGTIIMLAIFPVFPGFGLMM